MAIAFLLISALLLLYYREPIARRCCGVRAGSEATADDEHRYLADPGKTDLVVRSTELLTGSSKIYVTFKLRYGPVTASYHGPSAKQRALALESSPRSRERRLPRTTHAGSVGVAPPAAAALVWRRGRSSRRGRP